MNNILAAIRLGRVLNWGAFYHDGTSRRQLSLYNLLIAIDDEWSNGNGNDSPMIVSSCIVSVDGTAEGIRETIGRKVSNIITIVIINSFLFLTICFVLYFYIIFFMFIHRSRV